MRGDGAKGKHCRIGQKCYNERMTRHEQIQKTRTLKLVAVGNSTGVILPKDVLQSLGVQQGDQLSISRVPNGIEIRPYDPDFEEQMAVARDVMRRRKNALRELAK